MYGRTTTIHARRLGVLQQVEVFSSCVRTPQRPYSGARGSGAAARSCGALYLEVRCGNGYFYGYCNDYHSVWSFDFYTESAP